MTTLKMALSITFKVLLVSLLFMILKEFGYPLNKLLMGFAGAFFLVFLVAYILAYFLNVMTSVWDSFIAERTAEELKGLEGIVVIFMIVAVVIAYALEFFHLASL